MFLENGKSKPCAVGQGIGSKLPAKTIMLKHLRPDMAFHADLQARIGLQELEELTICMDLMPNHIDLVDNTYRLMSCVS